MATLKTRLSKLEGCQTSISKQNIVVYPSLGQTKTSVMKEKCISADELGDVWMVEFVSADSNEIIKNAKT